MKDIHKIIVELWNFVGEPLKSIIFISIITAMVVENDSFILEKAAHLPILHWAQVAHANFESLGGSAATTTIFFASALAVLHGIGKASYAMADLLPGTFQTYEALLFNNNTPRIYLYRLWDHFNKPNTVFEVFDRMDFTYNTRVHPNETEDEKDVYAGKNLSIARFLAWFKLGKIGLAASIGLPIIAVSCEPRLQVSAFGATFAAGCSILISLYAMMKIIELRIMKIGFKTTAVLKLMNSEADSPFKKFPDDDKLFMSILKTYDHPSWVLILYDFGRLTSTWNVIKYRKRRRSS